MNPTVLLVEDDESIAIGIRDFLISKGFTTDVARSVNDARMLLNKRMPDLIILDWNLPDGTGDQLCLWIRERWRSVPVIFLTVRGDTGDILQGFKRGADDYMVKPFDLEILYSRINAVLRRTGNIGASILVCGDITVDKNSTKVFRENEEVPLSSLEYQLLVILMENKNRTLLRTRLLEHIWDQNGNFVNDNTLTVAMKRLREKLHNPRCIKTLRSLGYRMEDEV